MRRADRAWGRHAADLSVLAIGPRGPADEISASWDDVEDAAQASGRGTAPSHGPRRSASIRLARPSLPTAARVRPGASR